MSLGGGKSREWMKPLTADGRSHSDEFGETIGNSDGPMAQYAISNPKPGRTYSYERMDGEAFVRVRQEGGRFLKTDDPTKAVFAVMEDRGDYSMMTGKATPMDGTQNNGEVVLVEWSPEAARKKYERDQAKALAYARGGAEDFVRGASAAERAASAKPTRFRRSDHSLQGEDATGAVVESWSPDAGIIREG